MSSLARIGSCLALASCLLAGGAWAKPVRLGAGAHTYEWVPGWLKLPAGMNVGATHGEVVIGAGDRIFFSVDTGNSIFEATADGRIVRVFAQAIGPGNHGMRLVKDKETGREVIWLANVTRHEVLKISLDGELLLTVAYPDRNAMYKEQKEYTPTALDVAPNGDLYVADGYGRYWVHRFDGKGQYIQSWNGSEGKAGPLREPHGLGIDTRGPEPRVVVADRQNHRLQIFTLDGRFVDVVEQDLRLPSKVVFKGDDAMIVDLKGRVTIFDKQWKVVTQLGDNSDPELRGKFPVPPSQWKDGEFISPHGAAWDSKGNLYVEDWNSFGRVSKLMRVRAAAPGTR